MNSRELDAKGAHQSGDGSGVSRRDLFRVGGLMVAGSLSAPLMFGDAENSSGAAATGTAPSAPPSDNVYTRIGVRPYINLTAAYTIHGGLQTLPSVKQAMEEASYYSVNLDELMEKVGEHIAQLLGSEAAMVSCGCASAAAHATAASITGGDPEKIARLPYLMGLKNEVIMPRESRNEYDFAIRSVGVKIITVSSREELFNAVSERTAMLAILAQNHPIRMEDMVEAARKVNAPVFVDAAAQYPVVPNPYLARGADLVGYSGGKVVRGPQCAGVLLGRKDLIRAAWISSSPHHGFGRMMKVGKEEIMGMLAAVETLVAGRNPAAELELWDKQLAYIGDQLSTVPGVTAKLLPPPVGNPHPPLHVEWDPERIGMTASELHHRLLEGEPRIMILADGDGHSCVLRAAGMNPGDEKPAAGRLVEVFQQAVKEGKKQMRPPAADISGQWLVEMQYAAATSKHSFALEAAGNKVSGTHLGQSMKGPLEGWLDGDHVHLRSSFKEFGWEVKYTFNGQIRGNTMSGEAELDEYGRARWTAARSNA